MEDEYIGGITGIEEKIDIHLLLNQVNTCIKDGAKTYNVTGGMIHFYGKLNL